MAKIYFDTTPIIYFLDNELPFSRKVASFIFSHQSFDDYFITSTITDVEYLVFPYRNKNITKIALYNKFLSNFDFQIVKPNRTITQKAAELRALYPSIKGMDAIHLTTAIITGCDIFLTNDKDLEKIDELNIVLVDNL